MRPVLKMVQAVLIDLSGTLHIEDTAIPGAVEALKRLRATNVNVKFVTNTTKESRNFLYGRLKNLGFELDIEEIHSSLGAAQALIKQRKLKPMLMLAPEALEDFENLGCPESETPDSVIIGLAPNEFHYDKLNQAFRHVMKGAKLIGIHSAKFYKRPDGIALGPGLFVKGLEYATQTTAELVGKPSPQFFLTAIGKTPPSDVIMIGDDVVDDIEGAMKCGMQGFLIKTGKYLEGDENKISPRPSAVFPSFVEAVEEILKSQKK